MKILVFLTLLSCSFIYNLKLKVKNTDISEFENGFGNTVKFAESIFSDKGKNILKFI